MSDDPRSRITLSPAAPTEPSPSADEVVTQTGLEPPRVPQDAMPTLTEELDHLKPALPPWFFKALKWLDDCRAEIAGYRSDDNVHWSTIQHETSKTRQVVANTGQQLSDRIDALTRQNIELMTAYGAIVGSLRPPLKRPSTSGIVALLVDDEKFVVSALARLLESRGIRTIEASNSQEAIAALAADPTVAMVDILLGAAESGLDLIRRMKQIRPTLKCLIYSALITDEQRAEATALGARVIDKPARDVEELVSEIVRAHGAELAG